MLSRIIIVIYVSVTNMHTDDATILQFWRQKQFLRNEIMKDFSILKKKEI